MTTEAWVAQWISLRAGALRPRTVDSYRSLLRLHIAPAIGRRQLRWLKPEQVAGMLAGIVERGHARTAQLCYVLLRSALAEAVRLRRLRSSPLDAVQRPAHRQRRGRAWSPEEIQRYLVAIRGHRHRLAFLLAISLGLRRGEICGLQRVGVDLRRWQIHVYQQRVRLDDGRLVVGPPKSDAGDRALPVPRGALRQLLRVAYLRTPPEGFLVPITPSGLDAAHRRLLLRLDLPYIRLHDLRHTMGTNAVRNGASIRALADVLGHADSAVTAKFYTHPDADMLAGVIDAANTGLVY